jgi:exportin-1
MDVITTIFCLRLDHPEHRILFFKFLRDANEHCFYGLFSIAPAQQKLVVDSIVWAFKHTERNISETGLEILEELLQNIAHNPQISQPFYQTFLLSLIQDVMGVMTDRLHKSGFKQQGSVLMHLFHLVQTGQVGVPLFDSVLPNAPPGMDNAHYLKEHVAGLLMDAFPNLTKAQVVAFVLGLFDTSLDLNDFKQHLRDFLIAVKEFASEDNSELFSEETEAGLELTRQEQWQYRASVPGLLKPSELPDSADGDRDI